jgi:anti-sigma factor RsiW
MRRPALYSSSRSGRSQPGTPLPEEAAPVQPAPVPRWRRIRLSSTRLLWAAIIVLAAALAFTVSHGMRNAQRKLTQDDINAAVLKTLETQVLPSEYAKAYENILPSVVRVVSYVKKSRL